MPCADFLQGIWYFFGTRPSPFFGITDFYVLDPISRGLAKKWRVSDLGLRDRLGGGNFGQVYEGVIANKDIDIKKVKQLTSKQKKRRVVLKKVNLDKVEVRADFLRSGTMAKVLIGISVLCTFGKAMVAILACCTRAVYKGACISSRLIARTIS